MFSFFKPRAAKMNIRKIDEQFSITGQITPAEVKGVAEDEDPSRETLLRIVAEGLAALLACDAPATKEPG